MNEPSEQVKQALREAREEGRLAGILQADIDSHEKRLNTINGSIERGNVRLTGLTRKVDGMEDRLNQRINGLERGLQEFLNEWKTRDAVDQARDEALEKVTRKADEARKRPARALALFVIPIIAVVIGSLLNSWLPHVF